ncbi:MAG: SIMPL domain-containing protein [Burkholderiales bacterium]|nr:SIMPL domain-containing protein [Burkholderiales bacterium]
MALLVAACVLPGALISITFTVSDYRRQREQAMLDAVSTARVLASALDRDLASTEAGLHVLATSQTLLADDLPGFYRRSQTALPYQNVSNYVLLDASGRQVLNTLKPWVLMPTEN